MSGGYAGYGPAVVPGAKPAAIRLVAAALLFVVAGLAVGGSVGTFWIYTYTGSSPGFTYTPSSTAVERVTVTSMTNGWEFTSDDPVTQQVLQHSPLYGAPLTVGAVVAVVAAVMLIVTVRRAGDPAAPRLVGVLSSAILLGAIGTIWVEIVSLLLGNDSSSFEGSYSVGVGGWVLLVAAVVALVVVALLLTPRRVRPVAWPTPPPYPQWGYGPPGNPPGPPGPPAWAPPQGAQPGWAGPQQPWGPPPSQAPSPPPSAEPTEIVPPGSRPSESEQPSSRPAEGSAGPQSP